MVFLLNNHVDEHQLLLVQNLSFSQAVCPKTIRTASSWSTTWIFVTSTSATTTNLLTPKAWEASMAKDSMHGLKHSQRWGSKQKLLSISKMLSFRNSDEAKTCGGKSKSSTKSGETMSSTKANLAAGSLTLALLVLSWSWYLCLIRISMTPIDFRNGSSDLNPSKLRL